MERLLRYLADQNQYFKPEDCLSNLVDEVIYNTEDELSEDDLLFVQAARGSASYNPASHRKEKRLS